MIRIETEDGWILANHQDHARLAGAYAKAWKAGPYPVPEPFEDVFVGVNCHDDAWVDRDAKPCLTPEKRPSAFSKELVGTYDAFEDIDLEDYLGIRGQATEAVAKDNALGAILVSMHTVNLLTEQADLSGLSPEDLTVHSAFIQGQLSRQEQLLTELKKERGDAAYLSRENLEWAFRFLQACDSLSLITCVQFPKTIPLRHHHVTPEGKMSEIVCYPEGSGVFSLSPWIFAEKELSFQVPVRVVKQKEFTSEENFREIFASAQQETYTIILRPKA